MDNLTLFQSFHWYYPGTDFWKHMADQAEYLSGIGFNMIWLPPAYKSAYGASEPGYSVYDLFDLGEFDQKNSVATKWGTKEEFLSCIKTCQDKGLKVLADVVFNHRDGGDETEKVPVKEVNPENRTEFLGEEKMVDAFTKYTFPGRKKKYSRYVWDWHSFSGFSNGDGKIYKIQNEYGPGWDEVLSKELGNYDYLMGADVDFRNPFVRKELKHWAVWFYKTTNVDGFRLDAVKHMSPRFISGWVNFVCRHFQKDFFALAEYVSNSNDELLKYCELTNNRLQLFDFPLHHNFYLAGKEKRDFDLSKIFENTLVNSNPTRAVTFVDNHDTQPLQALESFVDFWFKPLANALILLRQDGIPCVFYSSLYGSKYRDKKEGTDEEIEIEIAFVPHLPQFIMARKLISYGEQRDYFDHKNCVGWTRAGIPEKQNSGCAVVMSNSEEGFKEMSLGKENGNCTYLDLTGGRKERITTNEEGTAIFTTNETSVSVWVKEGIIERLRSLS